MINTIFIIFILNLIYFWQYFIIIILNKIIILLLFTDNSLNLLWTFYSLLLDVSEIYRLTNIFSVAFLDYTIIYRLLRKWLELYFKWIISCFIKRIFHLITLISAKHHRWFWHIIRFCFKVFMVLEFCFSIDWYLRTIRQKNWLNKRRGVFIRCI